jgi:hypothetical protein
MDRALIIVTPCSRPEELGKLNRSITFPCTWIVVFDATEPLATVENSAADVILLASPGGVAGKHQVNTALDYCRAHGLTGFVYVLDDDNVIHEDFYDVISAAIGSGRKGYIFQQEIAPGCVRNVSPDEVKATRIDQAQFLIHTDLMRHRSYQQHHDADGYLIESLFEEYAEDFEFVHKTIAYYNRLRWDVQTA